MASLGAERDGPLLRKVDAITVPVTDLNTGIRFYVEALGHALLWRNDQIGQAGLGLPEADTEIVLTTRQGYEPNWLVESADEAATRVLEAGGRVLHEPFDVPVGRMAVVADPFENVLVLLDLSNGRYVTDEHGQVTGVVALPYDGRPSAPDGDVDRRAEP
ncbi:MAG: VOC family protein [Candidatus Dormibacteraceae bacterium]